jgi:predicted P-loop ATPase
MTQKLVILDDEWGGKSKNESKRIKELTSKESFSLREPYGRANVTLKRLAVLAGTCNELEVLNDPTGNRRILPIEVKSISHSAYNSIDKEALWAEAVSYYKSGAPWRLSKEFIEELKQKTQNYQMASVENELISKYYAVPTPNSTTLFLTTTDIKSYIEEQSGQRTNINKIGAEMRSLGFKRKAKKVNGMTKRGYEVIFAADVNSEPPVF